MKRQFFTTFMALLSICLYIPVYSQQSNGKPESMIFTLSGTVSNIQTGELLPGTTVTADTFSTITNDSGYYSLTVYSGIYDIEYQKPGYQDHTINNVSVFNNLEIDVELWEELYAPGWIVANVNDDESECLIDWTFVSPVSEIAYDDGTAEDYLVYNHIGHGHAVKFDPMGYPCYVKGGRFYVGDGSFPVGSNFLGSTCTVKILDDDGNNGKPGTTLATQSVTIDNYLWIEVDSFNVEITEGKFYVGMFQDSLPPYAAPIGIDQTMPTYGKSYSYISYQDYWTISSYQDFMIRALVSGDPDSDQAREALAYKVTRFSNFDPDGTPANGDSTILNDSVPDYTYNDTLFEILDEGWYAYGVAALYDQNGPVYSEYNYSNIVGKNKKISVTLNITSNTGELAEGAEIELTGIEFPYEEYNGVTDNNASCTFDPVWKGTYEVNVFMPYYHEYTDTNLVLTTDTIINIELLEIIQAPTNLYVDPLNSTATWDAPVIDTTSKSFYNLPFLTENQNITKNPASPPPTGSYLVILDEDSIASVNEENHEYLNLSYGQDYTAGVSAIFMSGNSDTTTYNFTSEWLYPPENLQTDTNNNIFWTAPKAPWPDGDSIPENLIGFNLYRDGEFVDYEEYWGGDTIYFTGSFYNLWPSTYQVEVSAVYDLTPYGIPGEDGESITDGPVDYLVSYGFPIPFIEEWESGDFEENDWEVQCENWWVTTEEGIPEPTASFSGQPLLENYDCGLLSYPMNGLEMADGKFTFDFDLKLDISEPAPTEKLIVRIWENGEWYGLDTIIATESFDWMNFQIETYEHTGTDFRIGFFCVGENSSFINSWQIDNVVIDWVCPPPRNLNTFVDDINPAYAVILLEWFFPRYYNVVWIDYSDGTYENAFASTDGGAGLAQLFSPVNENSILKKIRYFNSGFEQYQQTEEVWILSGDGETVLGGPYYIENAPADDWISFYIEPITLNNESFMIATFNTDPGGPYVGADGTNYNENLYFGSIGNFTELGEYGYYYVGSHAAGFSTYNGKDADSDEIVFIKPDGTPIDNNSNDENLKRSRNLAGFNVYRNDSLINENFDGNVLFDTVYEAGEYCYSVNAVYNTCESDTIGPVCETFFVGLEEELQNNSINIYPNPATEALQVESKTEIESIQILNANGMLIRNIDNPNGQNIRIDCSEFNENLLIVKITSESEIIYKKVLIIP